jgi:hypothetical protein
MATFTGRCLCGAIHYGCSSKPVFTANCHCRDCQRITGSGFSPIFFVSTASVVIKGDVKYYHARTENGEVVSRGFCLKCGSQLFGKVALNPDLIAIRAGTLDNPDLFHPHMNIYTASAQHWDYMDPALPNFPQMPPKHIQDVMA